MKHWPRNGLEPPGDDQATEPSHERGERAPNEGRAENDAAKAGRVPGGQHQGKGTGK